MDINQVITQLRAERDLVEQAIANLERLSLNEKPRRGRPPAWMTARRREELEPAKEAALTA